MPRLEEHPNTLAIDLMSAAKTSRRLKRKQPRIFNYTINDNLYVTRHILFKTFTNCQMYYSMLSVVTDCNNS